MYQKLYIYLIRIVIILVNHKINQYNKNCHQIFRSMSIRKPAFQKHRTQNKSNLNISYAQDIQQQGAYSSINQSNKIKFQKFKAFKKASVRNLTNLNDNYNLQPQANNLLNQINTSNISQCATQFNNKNESNYFGVDSSAENEKKKKQKSKNFSFLSFKKKISVQENLLNKYPKLTISDERGKVTSLINNNKAKKEEKQKNIQIAKQIIKAIFPQQEENNTETGPKRKRKHSMNVLSNIYEIQQVKLKKITQKSLQLDKSQKNISNSHQLCQNCHKYLNYNNILKQTIKKFKNIVDNFKQLEQFYRKFAQYLISWKLQIKNKIIDIEQLDKLFIQPLNKKQILNQISQFQIAEQQYQIINQCQKGQSKFQKQLVFDSAKKIDQKYKYCKINDPNSKFRINNSSQKSMKQEYISSIDNKSEKSQFSMKSIGKIVKNYKFDKSKELLFQFGLKNQVDDKLYINKIQQTSRTPRSPPTQKIKLDFIKMNLQNKSQVQRKIGKIKKNPKYDSPQTKSNKSRSKKLSTSFFTSRTNSNKKQADNCFSNILQALNNIKSTCL